MWALAIFCYCKKKLVDFPDIKYEKEEYFNLVHEHKSKFGLFLPFFHCRFLFLGPSTFAILCRIIPSDRSSFLVTAV